MINGKPPIWAAVSFPFRFATPFWGIGDPNRLLLPKGRQELCEALVYFRAFQGGHYDLGEFLLASNDRQGYPADISCRWRVPRLSLGWFPVSHGSM